MGFYTYIFIACVIFLLQIKYCFEYILLLSWCPIGTLWLTNLLTVMIFRWRHAGKVCSGDFLTEEERRILHLEPQEPYLIDTGFFLLMAIYSQFFAFFVMINMYGFLSGVMKK